MPKARERAKALTPDERRRAERLRSTRESLGLSASEVARRLGIKPHTYTQYETGRRGISLDRLIEFAAVIGCDPHALDERLASTGGG